MLRYKTKTRPGLVALYDIRPGNGAGPFLQPRSQHGAQTPGAYTQKNSGVVAKTHLKNPSKNLVLNQPTNNQQQPSNFPTKFLHKSVFFSSKF